MPDLTRRDGLKLALGAAVGLPLLVAGQQARAGVVFEVEVKNFAFSPSEINAKPGDTLRITNKDKAPHTATARDGAFDSGTIKAGKSADVTLSVPAGAHSFFCRFHPKMVAVVNVT